MNIVSITGYQSKSRNVIVENIGTHTDEQILLFALEAAGLRKSNLFGWKVIRSDLGARVRLDLD